MSPIRRRLLRARAATELVRLERPLAGDAPHHEGYVVDVGARWVLLSVTNEAIAPGGFRALRVRDVHRVSRSKINDRFVRASLEAHDAWPPPRPSTAIDLDTTGGLLDDLAAGWDLLTVYVDGEAEACSIGQLRRHRGRRFTLAEVNTQGEWDGVLRRTHAAVDRLDVGGAYEAALFRVAGPRPGTEKPSR
ncbi:hypothetical protein [Nakamurella endophytica]|uniref:Uncharacterized protein n=1 Tax=Nakamurella endophytica TaxID=1748367 RepID=A0A917STR8_9ACTN|nr:hypothetical protein [Nakamurella endophytica]GGL94606.1 hypothetical protein GCM10011594_13010 [Nakamurella endophytica]